MTTIDPHTEERSRLKYLLAREEFQSMLSSDNAETLLSNAHVMLNAIASGQCQYILEQSPERIYNDMMIALLEITGSSFGFVGQLENGSYAKKTVLCIHAFTNLPVNENFSMPATLHQERGQFYFKDLDESGIAELITHKTVLINNKALGKETSLFDFIPGNPEIQRYVLVPLLSGAQIVGVVGLMNSSKPYEKKEMTFLQPLLRSMANLMRTHAMEVAKKKAEQQLAEREKLLQKFIRSAPAAIAMLDSHLNYIMASNRWISTFQLGAKNIISRSFFQLHPTLQENWAPLMPSVLAGHKKQGQDDVIVMKNGEMRWLKWALEPWFSTAGKQGGVIIFVEDMTHEKKALLQKTQLIEKLKQTNKELQLFTQFCTHDLKEPLRTISSFAQIIKRDNPTAEKREKFLDIIMSSSKRMNDLVNDLLHFTSLEDHEPQFEQQELNQLIDQVKIDLSELLREKNGNINYSNLPNVKGDETLLRQLFQNLISNGLKFNENQNPTITIESRKKKDFQEILVRDNGIGINPNYQGQIFSMFKRVHGKKYGGSGVGLAICKKIIQLHGGDISVQSKEGEGSTFCLKFPLA